MRRGYMLDEVLAGFVIGTSVDGEFALGKPREIEDNIAVKSFSQEESWPQLSSVGFPFHFG